jgi:hypothetical protein
MDTMKTTKIVEITLCDVCGNEKRHQDWPCSRCKRDICDGCEESFYVEMRHNSKERQYPSGNSILASTNGSYINLGYSGRVCRDCAVTIVAGLDALGLVGKPKNEVDEFMAVMD